MRSVELCMKKPIKKSFEKKKPAKNKVWLIVLVVSFGFLLFFILFFGRVTGLAHFAPRIFKWCGDGICEGKENCGVCAQDCTLMPGDICCNNLILHGDCCDNAGCSSPKETNRKEETMDGSYDHYVVPVGKLRRYNRGYCVG